MTGIVSLKFVKEEGIVEKNTAAVVGEFNSRLLLFNAERLTLHSFRGNESIHIKGELAGADDKSLWVQQDSALQEYL
ncbi:hypothetical protein NEMIN01_1200, partial [Nematocida minor]|uniref:uncharacterized protein n=1 Tax=Nematocida minor TaxID=1912983 RepID=UPI0022201529